MKSFKNQNNDFKFSVNLRGKLIKQEQFWLNLREEKQFS